MAKARSRGIRAADLERRITNRAEINPKGHQLAQAADLAELHARDRSRFRGLIERGTLTRRKAFYLLKVGTRLLDGTIPRRDAEEVGWTKLAIIADRLTRANAQRLLRQARETPADQLKKWAQDDKREATPHCVLLYFSSAQYEHVWGALKAAGAVETAQGLADKEQAFMSIIGAWSHGMSSQSKSVP